MSKYIKFNGAVYQKVAAAGDWAWLGSGERIFVPDVKITRDDPSYVYHPLRGYSASVAVENIDGRFIGWMSVDDLPGGPYKNTREWMVKNKVTGWEQARDYVPPSPRYEDTHYTRPKHYPTIGTVHKKVASVSLDEEAVDTILRKCDREAKRIMGTQETPESFRLKSGVYYIVGGIAGEDSDAITHYIDVVGSVAPGALDWMTEYEDRGVLNRLYHEYRRVIYAVEEYLNLHSSLSHLGDYRVDEQKAGGYTTNVYFVPR